MSTENGAGANTPDAGAGSSQPGADAVGEAIERAVKKYMKKSGLWDELNGIKELVKQAVTKPEPKDDESPAKAPSAGNDAAPERLNLKALQEQIANLTKVVGEERQARAKAEAGAKDARMRAEVERRLTAKLGADSPLVGTLMDSLYDVKKRFVEGPDGRLSVKFNSDGFDEFKPLDEGVETLFAGELKNLVQHSKAGALPPSGYPINGRPAQPQTKDGKPVNPVAARFAQALAAPFAAQGEEGTAQSLLDAFVNGSAPASK